MGSVGPFLCLFSPPVSKDADGQEHAWTVQKPDERLKCSPDEFISQGKPKRDDSLPKPLNETGNNNPWKGRAGQLARIAWWGQVRLTTSGSTAASQGNQEPGGFCLGLSSLCSAAGSRAGAHCGAGFRANDQICEATRAAALPARWVAPGDPG